MEIVDWPDDQKAMFEAMEPRERFSLVISQMDAMMGVLALEECEDPLTAVSAMPLMTARFWLAFAVKNPEMVMAWHQIWNEDDLVYHAYKFDVIEELLSLSFEIPEPTEVH